MLLTGKDLPVDAAADLVADIPPGVEAVADLGGACAVGQVDGAAQGVVVVVLHAPVARRIEAEKTVAVAVMGQQAAAVLFEHRAVVVEVLDIAPFAAVVTDAHPLGVVVVLAEDCAVLRGLDEAVGDIVFEQQILARLAAVGLEGGVAVVVVLVSHGGAGHAVDHLGQPVGFVVAVGFIDGGGAIDGDGFGFSVMPVEGIGGDPGGRAAGQGKVLQPVESVVNISGGLADPTLQLYLLGAVAVAVVLIAVAGDGGSTSILMGNALHPVGRVVGVGSAGPVRVADRLGQSFRGVAVSGGIGAYPRRLPNSAKNLSGYYDPDILISKNK